MTPTEWTALIGAIGGPFAALLAFFTVLLTRRSSKEAIAAKDAVIESLRQELASKDAMTAPYFLEHFTALKAASQDALDGLSKQLDAAGAARNLLEGQIGELEKEGATRIEEMHALRREKEELHQKMKRLALDVQNLRKNPSGLLSPPVFERVLSSSSAVANSVTTNPTIASPLHDVRIPPELSDFAAKVVRQQKELEETFGSQIRKATEELRDLVAASRDSIRHSGGLTIDGKTIEEPIRNFGKRKAEKEPK